MKKLLVIAALALTSMTTSAGLLDAAATSNWPVKPTTKYKLDVYGFNARAYEFTTDNGMRCVMVFPGGEVSGWQMQCLPR